MPCSPDAALQDGRLSLSRLQSLKTNDDDDVDE